MPLSVAEYLGQRTDNETSDIIPSDFGGGITPTCPFSGVACIKLALSKPNHPVCSVRTQDGTPYIVCPDRLIPSKAHALSPSHIAALGAVAQVVFPGVESGNIGYRRQVSVTFAPKRRLILDYVLQVAPTINYERGSKKVILEVQGGGETSSTGAITAHIARWSSLQQPTNKFLARPLDAAYIRELNSQSKEGKVNTPGIIPNNAWKRQLDQVIKKAALTLHFGGAFALVMGEALYDYVKGTLPVGREHFPEWEIALLGVSETPSKDSESIRFNAVSNAVFMTYAEFINALQLVLPPDLASPFGGEFTTLRNRTFTV
jgi:hypothetical protein